MRQTYVAGNWKMNGNLQQLTSLSEDIKTGLKDGHSSCCIVFPPAIYLSAVQKALAGSSIAIGAQNIYPADAGAFTGELSASMLKEFDCKYVLVGHSERRHILKENEKFVAEKFHHVKDHDMIPVLCVGETLKERENKQTEMVIARQLEAVVENDKNCFKNCIIAYEPVWAIGTGKTATAQQAQDVHQFIRALVAEIDGHDADELSILYGGSVNEKNARTLFSMPDVDGGLVGGASLNAGQFVEIVKCIN